MPWVVCQPRELAKAHFLACGFVCCAFRKLSRCTVLHLPSALANHISASRESRHGEAYLRALSLGMGADMCTIEKTQVF